MPNKQRRKKVKGGRMTLKSSYGYMILPKGFRLYHMSSTNLCELPQNKELLFTTLHPSDWYSEEGYISTIELQRDITLFFMISRIFRKRIQSALIELLNIPRINMVKMNPSIVKQWMPYLQQEGFDGWFSSIEGKTSIEFVIENDHSILKILRCKPIVFNWANSYYTASMNLVKKDWGTEYPISTLPVTLVLPKRFSAQIEEYKKEIEADDPEGTTFYKLLEHANITYKNSPEPSIRWNIQL